MRAKILSFTVLVAILFSFSTSTFAARVDCAHLLKKEDFDSFAKEVSEDWKQVEDEYRWLVWIDSDLDYRRFVNSADLQGHPGVHPTEMYRNGVNQFRGFNDANKYLNSVPVGQFKLSLDLFREVHRIAMKDVYSFREKLLYRVTGGAFNVVGPGKFKRMFNFGFNPLMKHPMTDAEVAAVRANGADRFWTLWRKGPEQNYGLIVFPGNSEKRLQELIQWYETNKTVLSPIQLAAGFQKRFISIHPFDNGNGRISRLIMDRILTEYGLPPAVLRDHNLDLFMSEDEWAKEVASGVAEFQEMSREILRETKKTKTAKGSPFIGDRDHGNWIRGKENADDLLADELLPHKGKALFRASNGETYVMFRDGYLYDEEGIPHFFRDGELRPIADVNYMFYGMGGRITQDAAVDMEKGVYRRVLSDQQKEIYQGNLAFVQRVMKGDLDPSKVPVRPYSEIEKANNKGLPVFNETDKKWLKSALRIGDEPPAAVLAANRGGFTEFEQSFQNGGSLRISSILAQYQTVDLNFARADHYFREVNPDSELVSIITESRRKLWEAGRYFLAKFEEQAIEHGKQTLGASFDRDAWMTALRGHPQFKLLYEYLPYTRIGYSTWEAATDAVPWDAIYLMRNDFEATRWTGFMTEAQFAKIVKSIPGAELFRNYVRKRLAGLTDEAAQSVVQAESKEAAGAAEVLKSWKFQKIYEALEKKIFVSPYKSRGVDEEYERMYVDLFLHSVDVGQKNGVSFSVRADQMVRPTGELAFQGIPGTKYRTYIVKMPVERTLNNFASGWFRQYEVIGRGYTGPFNFAKSFKPEDFTLKIDPAIFKAVEDFNTKVQRIPLLPVPEKAVKPKAPKSAGLLRGGPRHAHFGVFSFAPCRV